MKKYILISFQLVVITLIGQQTFEPISMDMDWKFHKGGAYGAEQPTFDDTEWRNIDVPHDWSIENLEGSDSPFASDAHTQVNGGFTTGGTGWYRKRFTPSWETSDKLTIIQFDGVYMNSEVYINGIKLGTRPYGYTTFQFDLTPHLVYGEENIIAVKVKNFGENSRWYSGSGIYRHVWMITKNKSHIKPWGVYITTPEISKRSAKVVVNLDIVANEKNEYTLETIIVDEEGVEVAKVSSQTSDTATGAIVQNVDIKNPKLWSLEYPHQYTAVTELKVGSAIVDRVKTMFGVRSISFDVENGFQLNGQKVLLKGGCIHHDNGPLGAKSLDRAEERKVELLKASGYNALRLAHNPPSQKLLEVCDRLGILVIDEAFDIWEVAKNPEDYHLFFEDWWKKDVHNMVVRDRNHPSIILWSMGNEIPERGTAKGVETAKKIGDYIKSLDATRPTTAAVNGLAPDKDPYFAALDVSGYNYAVGGDHNKETIYADDHKRIPTRIMYGAESYPLEAFGSWMDVLEHPYVIGDFVWTAWDYIGEAGIGWMGYPQKSNFYPWNLAYNGDFDICGWKRPQSHYRDALWKENQLSVFVQSPEPSFPDSNKDLADWSKWHWYDVVEHWNWQAFEGQTLAVDVYSSCDEVELFLNGKSLGKKATNKSTEFKTTFKVPYVAGSLKAIGYEGRKKVKTIELKTAGTPVSIKASADRTEINANGQDLSYITFELLDKDGVRNFLADDMLDFKIEGPGEIVAVANANPRSLESYTAHQRKAWRGRCMVIIKSTSISGDIKLTASSKNLKGSEVLISSISKKKPSK
ncbi:glycoside hydrolase family 2 TIM barrel-domain containing protein [Costertonia aggregata]|uniref:DUF4982 domain-containing protein n=1 Tax=Costertonia aggregata TaxID=343403 RepID=A0A7H9ANQ8_9FLAO|nr:glycoside hydrolase family 2 TIM barrel-domain containing protein [Costertonia aggregata]QLG45082.1 DUF4982 domain-containing protein [Costertonia aggregata]